MTEQDKGLRSAWQDAEHARHFDVRAEYSLAELKREYESHNEFQLLLQHLRPEQRETLLEIGCATGELYRYLKANHPQVTYRGADLSKPAIERARQKYPEGRFDLCGPDLAEIADAKPEILWCRDVVHHQPDPLTFLGKLIGISGDAVIIRTRTRDVGATVWDPELSCQWHYSGHWVPYIVMNVDELVAFVSRNPRVRSIRVLKRLEVLGGAQGRFLPKACYDPQTGTAESAVFIGLGERTGDQPDVTIEVRDDRTTPGLWTRAVRYLRRRGRK